ncbi:MAG: lysophospholipid acyltransferase family protein [Acidimicrobiia bacterium]
MFSYIRDIPRTLFFAFTAAYTTLFAGLLAWFLAARNPTDPRIERTIQWWAARWLRAARCTLEVRGADQVDTSRSYVVVANHVSNLDVVACFASIPLPIRYLAKKELFNIPVLAQAMRAVGIIEVDRSGRAAAIASVNRQSQPVIERGHSLIIYPEGTRSYHGELQPFKKGAFAMAVAARMPILPVAINGTWEAWKPHSPWIRGNSHITVTIHEPIETEGLSPAELDDLRLRTHTLIAQTLSAF